MKKYISNLLFFMISVIEFLPTCQAKNHDTTLTAKDLPYSASIALGEVDVNSSGRRIISYRIHLSSAKCKSDLTGVAEYYSSNESPIVDSEFLPNGHVVKTNMFKDKHKYGGLDLVWDVESKKPKYAAVYVKNYSDMAEGGCVEKSDAGYEFYDWRK